jgi:hypothetical protein
VSWTRWGSLCTATVVPMDEDLACPPETCPGSSLYIFESADGGIVCMDCPLIGVDHDFVAPSTDAMWDHLEDHVAAGHHVRPSIRRKRSAP